MTAALHRVDDALEREPVASLAREYAGAGQVLVRDRFITGPLLDELVAETGASVPHVHRQYFPRVRKAGVVGYRALRRFAPAMVQLYREPAFVEFVSQLAGHDVFPKSEADDHACAIYWYGKRGDYVRPHYDGCGCGDDRSLTVLIGLINDTASRLVFKRDVRDPFEPVNLEPGTMIAFNGSKLLHGVTPLRADEKRAVLSLAYRAAGPPMSRYNRLRENIKDAMFYFGPAGLLQWNYARRERAVGD